MLLLYLNEIPDLTRTLSIYIPLCFYFIYANFSSICFLIVFTFHYASTLSASGLWKCSGIRYLHSTMLLLYRNPASVATALMQNLHSTMLLLYLSSRILKLETSVTFTFHYASTLSITGWSAYFFFLIYIPLCFYFIRAHPESKTMYNHYLHSTMLLLYRFCRDFWKAFMQYLHSTMLLLYPAAEQGENYDDPHLHSTMLLLYHRSFGYSVTKNWIYIPLCFYFIRMGLRNSALQIQIYIPLCFYFIPELNLLIADLTVFTFHYASTLSFCVVSYKHVKEDLHSTMLLLYQVKGHEWNNTESFTFHYASTLSNNPDVLFADNRTHLHSTMLLLYLMKRQSVAIENRFTFHYASTLSIDARDIQSEDAEFTFHYASTLSLSWIGITSIPVGFTFHYASTLSKWKWTMQHR